MKGTIAITRVRADAAARQTDERNREVIFKNSADAAARRADESNREVIFKNFAPFMDCISEINNMQVDNPKDLTIGMLMYHRAGHILDLYYVRLLNSSPLCENYAKLYFDAKHLEKKRIMCSKSDNLDLISKETDEVIK